ncbi:serine/threonine-protein kinase LMTK1 isoform X2 [Bombina bombina]|uniref:serine/threonine-protein kinase LMTK1 isoform X2 n=1 Tax=Bombina bombina TaxID=8345 RepID=UPI00235ACD85|nr:serine/threonine-protein kinase LMTK1 isoform X2 [Bombina bombina]
MGRILLLVMMSSFFNPSFAFSSHFDSDGSLLNELSWPSSLAVVVVSFSGLITFIFLMLACLCCKKGDIGFKELDNVEGEDYTTEFSSQSTPAAQNGPEVYVLPLTEVSVPMSKQPGRSVQLLKSTDLGRQSLLYLKEIGHGWFGKVLLGEVNSGLSSTQVIVKELKVSASVQEQMLFLEETQPYRALQHANLIQCLAQCAEITPYLLVMEFCPLGDLKGYLQSCAATESTAPDPLTLQRMGCEICCGLLHLHRNNYTHSDLALRNCLLTADLTVKIGDYGLAHFKYRDDYLVTSDQLWVPLRWIAPELIDEVHGNLLVVDQTKASNVWSLGVTLWELFELGRQPYYEYSDRQVLSYVIKEQQLKLPKPQLKQLLSDRWFEVMQFCWLQPEQRPTVEEVHLLLSYLSVKGASELEEEFEKRWNSMKPNGAACINEHHEAELSSYPLLEHFSSDSFHSDGDDVLTVTETSQGLNFEYKWERGRHEQYPLSPGCQPYQDMYYTPTMGDRLSLGVSPSCYENKDSTTSSRPLEVVPVLSAHSPSVAGDYYIRIEEPLSSNVEQDYSPNSREGSTREESSPDRGHLSSSNNSPSISLTMEPLLEQTSFEDICAGRGDQGQSTQVSSLYFEPSSGDGTEEHLLEEQVEEETCVEAGFVDPLGASPSLKQLCKARLNTAKLAFLERTESDEKRRQVSVGQTNSLMLKPDKGRESPQYGDFQRDVSELTSCFAAFSPHWASNISSNNNICTAPTDHNAAIWCNQRSGDSEKVETEPFGPECWQNMESGDGDIGSVLDNVVEQQLSGTEGIQIGCGEECCRSENSPKQLSPPIEESGKTIQDEFDAPNTQFADVLLHPLASPSDVIRHINSRMDPLGACVPELCDATFVPAPSEPLQNPDLFEDVISDAVPETFCPLLLSDTLSSQCLSPSDEITEKTFPTDLYQIPSDTDDEDTMEITSGVFTDLSSERVDVAPSFRSLQKQVGTPDSLDSLDMPSTASSCDAFSLGTYAPSGQHRALDSGYDTENYESPEFVLKEPQDNRETDTYYQLNQSSGNSLGPGEISMSRSISSELEGLDAKNPYRDSAYFSDYDSFTKEEEEEAGQEEDREQEDSPKDHKESNMGLETLDSVTIDGSDVSKTEQENSVETQESQDSMELSLVTSSPEQKDFSSEQFPLIVKEDSVDEGLGLECHKASFLDKLSPVSTVVESSSHRTFLLSPVPLALTKSSCSKVGASGSITLTTGLQGEDKGTNSHRDVLGTHHLSKCLSPPLVRKEARLGESPEEEDDEESEDSDESDEELRCYNIQEQSEESEEEHGTIPIVITDSGSSGHLRSLLKMHSFQSESLCTEMDRKKKVVSFYDDVTVYLFDQESPTRELAEQEFSEINPSNGPNIVMEQVEDKESTQQRLLTESGFEWEEDFPFTPVKTSFVTSLPPVLLDSEVHSISSPVPIQKNTLPIQLSRFSVSPTSLSRFSITQVADSEIQSAGGSRETGEQV